MIKSIIITALLACMAMLAFAGDQLACPAASMLLEQSGEPHLWVTKVFQMRHFKCQAPSTIVELLSVLKYIILRMLHNKPAP